MYDRPMFLSDDVWKQWLSKFIVQVLGRQSFKLVSRKIELCINIIVLVARWSSKGHFSVTLGKTQLSWSGLLGDRADLVDMIGLLRRWSCKRHTWKLLHNHSGLLNHSVSLTD